MKSEQGPKSLDQVTIISLGGPVSLRGSHQRRFLKFHESFYPHVKLYPHPSDKGGFATTTLRVVDRLVDALWTVQTPYTAVVGDDDFLMPKFADRAVVELNREPGLVAVDGIVWNLYEGKQRLRIRDFRKSVTSITRSSSEVRSLKVRMSQESAVFNPQFLGAVMRTETQRAIWTGLGNFPIRWTDNLAVMEALRAGDVRRFPIASQIRGVNDRLVDYPHDKVSLDALPKSHLLRPDSIEMVLALFRMRGYTAVETRKAINFLRASVETGSANNRWTLDFQLRDFDVALAVVQDSVTFRRGSTCFRAGLDW